MSFYNYGMRNRPFNMWCQPRGVVNVTEDENGKYYNIITYEKRLSSRDLEEYELEYLGTSEDRFN